MTGGPEDEYLPTVEGGNDGDEHEGEEEETRRGKGTAMPIVPMTQNGRWLEVENPNLLTVAEFVTMTNMRELAGGMDEIRKLLTDVVSQRRSRSVSVASEHAGEEPADIEKTAVQKEKIADIITKHKTALTKQMSDFRDAGGILLMRKTTNTPAQSQAFKEKLTASGIGGGLVDDINELNKPEMESLFIEMSKLFKPKTSKGVKATAKGKPKETAGGGGGDEGTPVAEESSTAPQQGRKRARIVDSMDGIIEEEEYDDDDDDDDEIEEVEEEDKNKKKVKKGTGGRRATRSQSMGTDFKRVRY